VRGVVTVDAAEAPADDAHLAAVLVVQVAHLLLERLAELELEARVLPEAPGLHVVAARAQESLEPDHGGVAGGEAGHQQHRVPVAAWRGVEDRQERRQHCGLQQGTSLEQE